MALEGEFAEIYRTLWEDCGTSPAIHVVYMAPPHFPNGEAALFYRSMQGEERPGIWVQRWPVPPDSDEPDLEGADVRELISLAHERGHEQSYREGTYEADCMPEEHRAWKHARARLERLGFEDWPAFEEAKAVSMARHRAKGTCD